MSEEQSFNPGNVEPAKVNFIEERNVQDEHLDESTPAKVEDTPTAPVATEAQAPNTPPVHAETQDSAERYKNLQAAFTKVSQEKSELKTRLDQLEMRLAQQPYQQVSQPEPSTPAEPDELDKIAGEFEELKPIASRMKKLQRELDEQKNSLKLQQEDTRVTAQQSAQERQNAAILTAHSDAYAIAASIDFQGWLARQPSYKQPWMQTGTAEQVIDLLSDYKLAAGQQTQQQDDPLREARIAGAPINPAAPIENNGNSGKRQWTRAEIDAMSFAEYEKHEVELDLAAKEGRVV